MVILLKHTLLFIFIICGYSIFISEYNNLRPYIDKKKDYNFSNKINNKNTSLKNDQKEKSNEEIQTKKNDFKQISITINKGDTITSILRSLNFTDKIIYIIISKIENYIDLRKIKVGDEIYIYKDKKDDIVKIDLYKDMNTIISLDLVEDISVEEVILEKKIFKESKEFIIQQSLYSDGIKNNLPPDILIKLIRLFSFDLDFQRDIKQNTIVSVSYDFAVVSKTKKIEYKDINYGSISIDNKNLEYFKYVTKDGFTDYFNREGKNVKKSLLKTPLDGARISSSFGMRKHPISGFNKMHKGVDFAASIGTPIYAGGNGTIEYLGNNGGYGKYIRIRHNNDFKTAYAHLSNYKKGLTIGMRVNQGDIIGYVGSTGRSTGPHLHYEIIFQNKHINPLKLKLPSGKILKGEELIKFNKIYKRIYADHLSLLYE